MIIISYPRYEGESWESFVLQQWRVNSWTICAMELCHLFDIWAVSADRDNKIRVEVEVGVVHYQGLAGARGPAFTILYNNWRDKHKIDFSAHVRRLVPRIIFLTDSPMDGIFFLVIICQKQFSEYGNIRNFFAHFAFVWSRTQ